jgi:hypothetical protein
VGSCGSGFLNFYYMHTCCVFFLKFENKTYVVSEQLPLLFHIREIPGFIFFVQLPLSMARLFALRSVSTATAYSRDMTSSTSRPPPLAIFSILHSQSHSNSTLQNTCSSNIFEFTLRNF